MGKTHHRGLAEAQANTYAKSTRKKPSGLIREAADRLLDLANGNRRAAIPNEAAGMWRHRSDLPDFAAARRSWDRG